MKRREDATITRRLPFSLQRGRRIMNSLFVRVIFFLFLLVAFNSYELMESLHLRSWLLVSEYEDIDQRKVDSNHYLKLWAGEAIRHKVVPIKTVNLIIVYCTWSLDWMKKDVIEQLPTNAKIHITIYSKCGNEDRLSKFEDPRITTQDVIPLPNIGGCDYGYAYYINELFRKSKEEPIVASSVYLFMKDTPRNSTFFQIFNTHSGYRNISQMMDIAQSDFVCGAKSHCDVSAFHDTAVHGEFILRGYLRQSERAKLNRTEIRRRVNESKAEFNAESYQSMRDFQLRALNYTNPNSVVEICYGGVFAVPGSRMKELSEDSNTVQVFERLLHHLKRNATITIEEHFSERTMTEILAYPVSKEETEILQQMATRGTLTSGKDKEGFQGVHGALWANRTSFCNHSVRE